MFSNFTHTLRSINVNKNSAIMLIYMKVKSVVCTTHTTYSTIKPNTRKSEKRNHTLYFPYTQFLLNDITYFVDKCTYRIPIKLNKNIAHIVKGLFLAFRLRETFPVCAKMPLETLCIINVSLKFYEMQITICIK